MIANTDEIPQYQSKQRSFRLTGFQDKNLDLFIKNKIFPNKSEAVRTLLTESIIQYKEKGII